MLNLPRAPLSYGKTERIDAPDNYLSAIRQLTDNMRDQAISERKLCVEFQKIPDYIAALQGDQWGRNRVKYRSDFVDNRLAKARIDSKSYLTDIQPTIDISTPVDDYRSQTTFIGNYIHHEWRRINMDLCLAETIDHANFGCAYGRLGAVIPGDFKYRSLGMDSVLPIQRGDNLQDSSAVLYQTHKPLDYFSKMFPGRTDGMARFLDMALDSMSTNMYTKPQHIDQYTWNSMSPAMKYKLGVRMGQPAPAESQPFPTAKLEEFWINDPAVNETKQRILVRNPYLDIDQHNYWYWVEPGQPLWPRKRLVIVGGENIILYDGPSPYWHGLYPFGELILDPIVWGPGGLSRYRTLLPINKGINEINAGVFDMVKKAMNQSLIGKKGSMADTSFDRFQQDMPGGKLMMNPSGNPATDLRYGPVPELPGYIQNFLQHLYQAFDRQAGGQDALAQIRGKKQAPSSDVLEQIKDSQGAQFRLEGRYVEAFLVDLGPQAVSNTLQFVTRKQRIRLFGKDGLFKQEWDFRPGDIAPFGQPREDHWKNFTVSVNPGSMHAGSRDKERNESFALWKSGAISLQELHRRLELTNSSQIIKELAEEHQAGVSPGGAKPRPQRSSGAKKGAAA